MYSECDCGECCDDCSDGPQGYCGAQGAATYGIQGTRGFQGIDVVGAQGDRGFQGEQTTGMQGLLGHQGPLSALMDGPQGDVGFQATNDQMQGPQGQMGQEGETGPVGFEAQGWRGSQGANNSGPQGLRGTQGASLDNGPQGQMGPQGTIFLPIRRQGPVGYFGIGPFTTPGIFRFFSQMDVWGQYKVDVIDSANVVLPGTTQYFGAYSFSSSFHLSVTAYLPTTGPYSMRFTAMIPSGGNTLSGRGQILSIFMPAS